MWSRQAVVGLGPQAGRERVLPAEGEDTAGPLPPTGSAAERARSDAEFLPGAARARPQSQEAVGPEARAGAPPNANLREGF